MESGTADRSQATVESAIRADPGLTDAQKEALLAVYRSYRATNT